MKHTIFKKFFFVPPSFGMLLMCCLLTGLSLMPVQAFAAFSYHSTTVQTDGTLLAWGDNMYGQLGDGTTVDKHNPVVVTDAQGNTITGIQFVTTGYTHTVALKGDGTLLAWGHNRYGQLGDGTTVNKSNPVVVTDALGNPITGVQSIAAGGSYVVALKTDGALIAWGDNRYGQLGDGTTVDKHNPVVVTDALGNPITGIQSVATGAYHTVALKTDGTLLAWGSNWNGLLGDGTTVDKSSPVVVTDALGNTITGIQSITAGYHHTLALKTDGTLLAWGYNTVGQLGDGTTVDKYNPVVVKDAQGNPITGIQSITAGYDHTLALKTDGTLLAWGVNWYGELGDGTTVDKHNPVVVTDALGNAVTNVATLMNNPPAPDTVPPVVTAPVDIYVSAVDVYGTPASNTLIADFLGRAAANDAVDGAIVPTNNAPATFPIGTTLVTFTATDAANNTATATANVIVQALATTAINNIANGATLAGTSQTFTWADTGASAYRLLVGSTFGGAGFFDSYALPAGTTSVTATGLPEKGVPVYVRLYAWTAGAWLKNDTRYVGASKPIATVTTPANGTTLAATSQTFSWTDTGADKYFLTVGNFAVGGSDLYSSGLLPAGTTSVTVNGLPNDGSTVYVRLYTWGNGAWQTSDTSYVAMPSTASVNNITNGATLAGTAQTFTWADTGAPLYYFIVGTAPGLGDIHQSGNLPAGTTSANVTGLPVGGVPVYVRLYSWGNGSWNTSNTTYTSAP